MDQCKPQANGGAGREGGTYVWDEKYNEAYGDDAYIEDFASGDGYTRGFVGGANNGRAWQVLLATSENDR